MGAITLTLNDMKDFIKYEQDHGGREKYVRVDRKKDLVGDCVIRAIAIATGKDYRDVLRDLCDVAIDLCRMPNNTMVYEIYLERLGWVKNKPYKKNGKTVEVRHFPAEPNTNYIIKTSLHLTAIVDRVHRDAWWCGEYRANSYYTKG